VDGDGRADLIVSGPDLNMDGIPDVLQVRRANIQTSTHAQYLLDVARHSMQPSSPTSSVQLVSSRSLQVQNKVKGRKSLLLLCRGFIHGAILGRAMGGPHLCDEGCS